PGRGCRRWYSAPRAGREWRGRPPRWGPSRPQPGPAAVRSGLGTGRAGGVSLPKKGGRARWTADRSTRLPPPVGDKVLLLLTTGRGVSERGKNRPLQRRRGIFLERVP